MAAIKATKLALKPVRCVMMGFQAATYQQEGWREAMIRYAVTAKTTAIAAAAITFADIRSSPACAIAAISLGLRHEPPVGSTGGAAAGSAAT